MGDLGDRISSLLEKYKVPGVSVSLIEDGEIVWSEARAIIFL